MALGAQPKLAAGGILSLMIVGLVSLFQSVGVLFGTSCLFSLVLIVVFLTSEGSPLLYAQEAENRFWTVVAMLLSSAVFFSEDSPLRIGNHSPVLGVTFVGNPASPNSSRRLRRISSLVCGFLLFHSNWELTPFCGSLFIPGVVSGLQSALLFMLNRSRS